MILCDYLSQIAVDKGDPGEVIPISFNALAQYRLAIDHMAEVFTITHFMVASRSGTNAAGIKLPPVHGAQKDLDPAFKPESQFKSQKILLKPTLLTPRKSNIHSPAVRRTPVQASANTKPRNSPSSGNVTPSSLLNTPVQSKPPTFTGTPIRPPVRQKIVYQQTPVRSQLIIKTPINAAPATSRKLVQKSVKLLNTPKSKASDKVSTSTTSPVNLFPSNDPANDEGRESLNILHLKAPIAPLPKLPVQQAPLPQENTFDINSELIPHQEKEIKAVFKAPELDDFFTACSRLPNHTLHFNA